MHVYVHKLRHICPGAHVDDIMYGSPVSVCVGCVSCGWDCVRISGLCVWVACHVDEIVYGSPVSACVGCVSCGWDCVRISGLCVCGLRVMWMRLCTDLRSLCVWVACHVDEIVYGSPVSVCVGCVSCGWDCVRISGLCVCGLPVMWMRLCTDLRALCVGCLSCGWDYVRISGLCVWVACHVDEISGLYVCVGCLVTTHRSRDHYWQWRIQGRTPPFQKYYKKLEDPFLTIITKNVLCQYNLTKYGLCFRIHLGIIWFCIFLPPHMSASLGKSRSPFHEPIRGEKSTFQLNFNYISFEKLLWVKNLNWQITFYFLLIEVKLKSREKLELWIFRK